MVSGEINSCNQGLGAGQPKKYLILISHFNSSHLEEMHMYLLVCVCLYGDIDIV